MYSRTNAKDEDEKLWSHSLNKVEARFREFKIMGRGRQIISNKPNPSYTKELETTVESSSDVIFP